ncbi:MAG TPA: hypothetical protein PKA10_14180 [Selenomonadales bacterium]|nr:hypothetical protein [Selenomonadales bacterium]
MLNYQATAFEELVKPLSEGKVLLLLEVTDPAQCDQIDYYQAILKGIGASDGSSLMENLLIRGFLKLETDLSDENKGMAEEIVDYFRQKMFKEVIRAYLFVDSQLAEHSCDGAVSAYDVMAEIGCPVQSITRLEISC